MKEGSKLIPRLVAVSGFTAWVVANGLDVLSMFSAIRTGARFALMPYHPAESFLLYAGFRLLGTIGVWLAIVVVGRRWPELRSSAWSALTAFALLTAIAAWWRVVQ
jgi:hypothetical protein